MQGIKIAKFCWGGTNPQIPQLYFEQTTFVCLQLALLGVFSIYNNIIRNHWSMQIFFTSRRGSDNMMNALEDCIIFLIWAARVLFIFYLKQKQVFSVWSFTENLSFISFHGGIYSRCSKIIKFEISKNLTFQK